MRRYTVLLYREEDGRYTALIPAFGALATYGDTVEHALAMARDAIELVASSMAEDGEEVPEEDAPPIVAAVEADVRAPAAVS